MQNNLAIAGSAVATQAPGVRFGRLAALAAVGLDPSACLHLQKPWIACTHCRDACPADCLSLEDGTVRLDATACLHCGRCAASCPTHALAVEGFELEPPAGTQVWVTCPRQPVEGAATIRVPCIGGLHINDLLAWLCRRPDQRVRLAADLGCSDCASGRKDATPAQGLAEAVEPILRSSSVPADRFSVGSTSSSLPDGNSRSRSAAPCRTDRPTASRRAFFSGIGRAVSDGVLRQAQRQSALLHLQKLDKSPRRFIAGTRPQETRVLMQQLAARFGVAPNRIVSPLVKASDACLLHGTCSRLCPTGALRVVDLDHIRELRFDAALCVDCGACAHACPESALRVEAPEWQPFESASLALARRRIADCVRCGDRSPDLSMDGLCAHCAKSAELARAGFALFGHGPPRAPGRDRTAVTAPLGRQPGPDPHQRRSSSS